MVHDRLLPNPSRIGLVPPFQNHPSKRNQVGAGGPGRGSRTIPSNNTEKHGLMVPSHAQRPVRALLGSDGGKDVRHRPDATFLREMMPKIWAEDEFLAASIPLIQRARNVGELAFLQLRLPEDRVRIIEAMLHPSGLLDMVQVDVTTRISIPMRRRKDTPAPQLQRLLIRQIVSVLSVQHTIGKCLSATNAEKVPLQPRPIAVDIVQRRAFLLGDASTHGSHAQTHALVRVDEVRQDLGRRRDRDAALVSELVETALHAQPSEPVLAVGRTASHGA